MARAWAVSSKGKTIGYMIFCPACGRGHLFYTDYPAKPQHNWTFNGDLEKPTFKPSMLVHSHKTQPRCHSHVTDGKIAFLNDCDHDMKGKTVDLPDCDEKFTDD